MEPKEWEKEFDAKFKCIQSDCDGHGNIPHQVNDDEWEAQQCEFHAKYLFPLKEFISNLLLEQKKKAIEAMGEEVDYEEGGGWESHEARGRNLHRAEVLKRLESL